MLKCLEVKGICVFILNVDGLVQERHTFCNSSALAMKLHLSCTNPSMYVIAPDISTSHAVNHPQGKNVQVL